MDVGHRSALPVASSISLAQRWTIAATGDKSEAERDDVKRIATTLGGQPPG